MSIEALCLIYLPDSSAYYHLMPLATCGRFDRLHIIRPCAASAALKSIPNTVYHEVSGQSAFSRLYGSRAKALEIGARPEVRMLFSFNVVPYGLLALSAGKALNKPVHAGFVGSDWHRHTASWYGGLIKHALKPAAVITVPGEEVRAGLRAAGFSAELIRILRHAIDTQRFEEAASTDRPIDFLFAGSLLSVKRVDLFLKALGRLHASGTSFSAAILGDGPLRGSLETLARELAIQDCVTFEGYQADTPQWFGRAKAVVIASEREGFPFALVEGMSAGAVPVASRVGCIPEFVHDRTDGLLFEAGDAAALSAALRIILEDAVRTQALREAAMSRTPEFGFESVAAEWHDWLGSIFERTTGNPA